MSPLRQSPTGFIAGNSRFLTDKQTKPQFGPRLPSTDHIPMPFTSDDQFCRDSFPSFGLILSWGLSHLYVAHCGGITGPDHRNSKKYQYAI